MTGIFFWNCPCQLALSGHGSSRVRLCLWPQTCCLVALCRLGRKPQWFEREGDHLYRNTTELPKGAFIEMLRTAYDQAEPKRVNEAPSISPGTASPPKAVLPAFPLRRGLNTDRANHHPCRPAEVSSSGPIHGANKSRAGRGVGDRAFMGKRAERRDRAPDRDPR